MPSMSSRKASYRSRVDYAEKAFLSGRIDSRKFDNCFESYDGTFVVVALMRRAAIRPELMVAIRRDFSGTPYDQWSWPKVAARYERVSDARLSTMAAYAQIEAEWHTVNVFIPQLQTMREEGAQPYKITRKEGPEEVIETLYGTCLRAIVTMIRSWTERTIMGVPFLSILAEISISTPEGETVAL